MTAGCCASTTRTRGGSAPHAPVVALLHGSGPGTTGWSAFALQRPALREAGLRLITPDLPGWGRSDGVVCKEDRSQLNARALQAVLDAAGVHAPVHLVGTSMGAHSAVAFALQWPGRVACMVLASGGTGGRSNFHPALPEGVRSMLDFYQEPTAARMRSFLECVVFDSSALTAEMVQQKLAAAMACPQHLTNFVESLRQHPAQFGDVTHRLAEITLPTLVIWGSEDRVVPLDIGLQIAQRIPGADLHVLGRCGHVPHLERPHDVNHLLTRFLA
ncbi:MAG: alpha/beta fold hydrolase [Acidovorax temperans]|uniref:alpha/beta fold hydrolase n=1 Tax=Acidovorax temperans TaxID=80878 RepID=UPI003918D949